MGVARVSRDQGSGLIAGVLLVAFLASGTWAESAQAKSPGPCNKLKDRAGKVRSRGEVRAGVVEVKLASPLPHKPTKGFLYVCEGPRTQANVVFRWDSTKADGYLNRPGQFKLSPTGKFVAFTAFGSDANSWDPTEIGVAQVSTGTITAEGFDDPKPQPRFRLPTRPRSLAVSDSGYAAWISGNSLWVDPVHPNGKYPVLGIRRGSSRTKLLSNDVDLRNPELRLRESGTVQWHKLDGSEGARQL